MIDQDLLDRLDGFESRLGRLETLLGVRPRAVPGHFKSMFAPPPLPIAIEISSPVMEEPQPVHVEVLSPMSFQTADPIVSYPSAPPRQPIKQAALEQTIGLKWAGWIGAVVLVIGAAFGIKFGYDQGWFSFVTPPVRLILMTLVGFALIALGEWVYRKVNQLSAVGLFGAGVALLFVISYAGYAYYEIYRRNAAFISMACSTVIGTLVARRGKLVSIAVLSMIGGNLAPALLRNGHPELFGFLSYLLLLQLTSLALAAWGASRKWWTLRGLSLATTALWILGVIDINPQQTTQIFIVIFAGLYQAELIFSARRSHLKAASAGVTFSILATSGLTAALLYSIGADAVTSRLICVLGIATVTTIISIGCFRVAKQSPALRALAIGYAMQSLALIVLAVPIALSGIWITAAWGGLAICLAAAGYVLDLPTARYAAVAIWGLAVGDLMFWSDEAVHFNRIAFTTHSIGIPTYAVMGWSLAVLGHLIAVIVKERRRLQINRFLTKAAIVVSVLGSCLWIAVSLAALPMLSATVSILVLCWILMGAGQLDDEVNLSVQAAIVFALATVKWAIVDTLMHRISPGWTAGDQLPFLTPNLAVAAIIVCSLWVNHFIPHAAHRRLALSRALLGSTVLVLVVFLWAGTFEIDRIAERLIPPGSAGLSDMQWKQLLWTIWWMLCSCGYLLVMHLLARGDRSQQAGMINRLWKLPAGIIVKFLLWDMLLYRIRFSPGLCPIWTGPQMIAGTTVFAGLILLYWFTAEPNAANLISRWTRPWIVGLAVATAFTLGSFAIDQALANDRLSTASFFTDPDRAEQVGLSIFWALFALGSVTAGFIWRTAGLRYFGLALYGLVLLKVVTIDLSQVSTGYRILSFIGLGGLLIGTSVLYGKLNPRLAVQTSDAKD